MPSRERAEEYRQLARSIGAWARDEQDVVAAAVVGSWARGRARTDSDVDVVVLTDDKDRYVVDDGWVALSLGGNAELVRTREWGRLTERRVRLSSGLEVEFGFAAPAWAATDPVDPGTVRVVVDGLEPLVDKDRLFARLLDAVDHTGRDTLSGR